MTCKDCLYSYLCRQNGTMMYYQHKGKQLMEDAEKACPWNMFKNKADYAEVVRCKDCKYGEHCYPCKAKGEEALEGWYCNVFRGWRSPYDYCSYGKQKTNLSTIPTGSEGRDT